MVGAMFYETCIDYGLYCYVLTNRLKPNKKGERDVFMKKSVDSARIARVCHTLTHFCVNTASLKRF